jgi:quercetin dioxygenase-like cupin family protein
VTNRARVATGTSTPAHRRGGQELWWLDGRMTIRVFGEQTSGRFSQLETTSPTGAAAPSHIHHREDETLVVLAGEVVVVVGDERLDMAPGDFVFLPRDVPHAYRVRSAYARWFVTFSPAGFERFFVEVGIPYRPGQPRPKPVVPDPFEFARLLAPYGCEVVGPAPDA